jgi:hypothetical protein
MRGFSKKSEIVTEAAYKQPFQALKHQSPACMACSLQTSLLSLTLISAKEN